MANISAFKNNFDITYEYNYNYFQENVTYGLSQEYFDAIKENKTIDNYNINLGWYSSGPYEGEFLMGGTQVTFIIPKDAKNVNIKFCKDYSPTTTNISFESLQTFRFKYPDNQEGKEVIENQNISIYFDKNITSPHYKSGAYLKNVQFFFDGTEMPKEIWTKYYSMSGYYYLEPSQYIFSNCANASNTDLLDLFPNYSSRIFPGSLEFNQNTPTNFERMTFNKGISINHTEYPSITFNNCVFGGVSDFIQNQDCVFNLNGCSTIPEGACFNIVSPGGNNTFNINMQNSNNGLFYLRSRGGHSGKFILSNAREGHNFVLDTPLGTADNSYHTGFFKNITSYIYDGPSPSQGNEDQWKTKWKDILAVANKDHFMENIYLNNITTSETRNKFKQENIETSDFYCQMNNAYDTDSDELKFSRNFLNIQTSTITRIHLWSRAISNGAFIAKESENSEESSLPENRWGVGPGMLSKNSTNVYYFPDVSFILHKKSKGNIEFKRYGATFFDEYKNYNDYSDEAKNYQLIRGYIPMNKKQTFNKKWIGFNNQTFIDNLPIEVFTYDGKTYLTITEENSSSNQGKISCKDIRSGDNIPMMYRPNKTLYNEYSFEIKTVEYGYREAYPISVTTSYSTYNKTYFLFHENDTGFLLGTSAIYWNHAGSQSFPCTLSENFVNIVYSNGATIPTYEVQNWDKYTTQASFREFSQRAQISFNNVDLSNRLYQCKMTSFSNFSYLTSLSIYLGENTPILIQKPEYQNFGENCLLLKQITNNFTIDPLKDLILPAGAFRNCPQLEKIGNHKKFEITYKGGIGGFQNTPKLKDVTLRINMGTSNFADRAFYKTGPSIQLDSSNEIKWDVGTEAFMYTNWVNKSLLFSCPTDSKTPRIINQRAFAYSNIEDICFTTDRNTGAFYQIEQQVFMGSKISAILFKYGSSKQMNINSLNQQVYGIPFNEEASFIRGEGNNKGYFYTNSLISTPLYNYLLQHPEKSLIQFADNGSVNADILAPWYLIDSSTEKTGQKITPSQLSHLIFYATKVIPSGIGATGGSTPSETKEYIIRSAYSMNGGEESMVNLIKILDIRDIANETLFDVIEQTKLDSVETIIAYPEQLVLPLKEEREVSNVLDDPYKIEKLRKNLPSLSFIEVFPHDSNFSYEYQCDNKVLLITDKEQDLVNVFIFKRNNIPIILPAKTKTELEQSKFFIYPNEKLFSKEQSIPILFASASGRIIDGVEESLIQPVFLNEINNYEQLFPFTPLIYKQKRDSDLNIVTKVSNYSDKDLVNQILDFGVSNKDNLTYYILDQNRYLSSKNIDIDNDNLFLYELSYTDLNFPYISSIWEFKYDISNDTITNNIDVQESKVNAKYARYSKGKAGYQSGTVTAIFGEFSSDSEFYSASVVLQKKWNQMLANPNPKILKDQDGHIWLIVIQSSSFKVNRNAWKQNENHKLEPQTTVTFAWKECGDVEEVLSQLNGVYQTLILSDLDDYKLTTIDNNMLANLELSLKRVLPTETGETTLWIY